MGNFINNVYEYEFKEELKKYYQIYKECGQNQNLINTKIRDQLKSLETKYQLTRDYVSDLKFNSQNQFGCLVYQTKDMVPNRPTILLQSHVDREMFPLQDYLNIDPNLIKENNERFMLPCVAEGGIGTYFMMLLLQRLKDKNLTNPNKKTNVILIIDFEYHQGSPTVIQYLQN